MKKTRVLIFTNCFRIGGSERQAVELAKNLDRDRFEPMMACFRNVGPLLEDLNGYVKDVQSFPLTGFRNMTALREGMKFFKFLRRARIDVLQSFDFYSNLFAIPLARLAGVPVILGCRRDEGSMRTPAHRKAERWSYAMSSGVVANAQAIKDQLLLRDGVRSERVWVIPNGLDLDAFDRRLARAKPEPKNGEITIAVVANLRPEKGHAVFLDVAQRLADTYPSARFLIIGDGSMRYSIESKIKALGLTEKVRMTGAVTDVPALLRTIDIAVLPSLTNEGFPNSVMEEMAASLPVVATDTGGTRELVLDEVTGYLVPAGDAAAMEARIGQLCRDPEKRKKMGAAGRWRIVEQFSVERMARRFESLYDQLVPAK